MMFYDNPRIVYENPPPPNDDFEYDFESIFFTYPRPQNIPDVSFLKIDRNLIHQALKYEEKEEVQIYMETIREVENVKDKENIDDINTVITRASTPEVSVYMHVLGERIDKNKTSEENLVKNGALEKTKVKYSVSPKNKSVELPEKNKEGKQKNRSKEKKTADSDESKKDKKKKDLLSNISALQCISKAYSLSESDSDNSEKQKTKPSSRHSKSHSKKSSRHRRKNREKKNEDSKKDSSCSDVIPYDKIGLRSAEISVKQEIISSDEESYSSSFSKKTEITVKEEILSDKDDYEKDKIKSSRSYRKKYSSRSHDDSKSRDHSRKYSGDSRNREDSRKNYSDSSSDDTVSTRGYDDSNSSSRSLKPHVKSEMKQEIKQEPGSTFCYGPNDYYCDVCKLNLNSESTFSSHMAGKKHKKTLRQLSEQEVAKSSVLEITESQNFSRPSDMDRIELHHEESKIQKTCEDADLLIVGLDYVREIRGYEETKYYCGLCSAQCVANSIIKHLIGFKHQMNCLKMYCHRSYSWASELEKRDRRIDRELRLQLGEAKRLYGRGKIKVFEDVKRRRRSPEPYTSCQASTSRQGLDVQGRRADDLKVTDEECLSRDYSDFYCKVCDSHMNNYSMWESHANGKRHAKNKKKAPEGFATNSNFIEAPRGTISHLEDMIREECESDAIIVGLNFIRENQGENGDLYNCYLCGSVSPSVDIINHLYLKKHKTKYLEKMLADGYNNAITEINILQIGELGKESLIDDECKNMMGKYGRGKPVVGTTKRTY